MQASDKYRGKYSFFMHCMKKYNYQKSLIGRSDVYLTCMNDLGAPFSEILQNNQNMFGI